MTGVLARRRLRRRAGASAVRQYEQRKREWQRKHRRLFWGIGAACVAVFAVTYIPGHQHPLSYWGGAVFGALGALLIALRESPPTWIENYQVGAWGEQRTAKAVEPLLSRGWVAMHDLTRIDSNLDHVLVGPAGVFVLDSKNTPGGAAEAKGDSLRLTRPDGRVSYEGDKLARQIRAQAVALHDRLLQRSGIRAWVDGVVVLWSDFPDGSAAGSKMSYVHGDHLVAWLERQPARLSAAQIREIAAVLEPGQRRRPRHSTDPATTTP